MSTTPVLFRVTTVAKRGALPHTEVVSATTKAKAFVAATKAHRKAQGLAPSVSLTCISNQPVELPKPVLTF